MNLNPDDPRLTAYALGELEPAECAAIETELAKSPDLHQAVQEIRQTAGDLREQFAAEPCPRLLPEQRQALEAQLQPDNIIHLPRWRFVRTAAWAAVAAVVMAALAWQGWFAAPAKRPPGQLAKVTPPTAAPTALNPTPKPAVPPTTQTPPLPVMVVKEAPVAPAVDVDAARKPATSESFEQTAPEMAASRNDITTVAGVDSSASRPATPPRITAPLPPAKDSSQNVSANPRSDLPPISAPQKTPSMVLDATGQASAAAQPPVANYSLNDPPQVDSIASNEKKDKQVLKSSAADAFDQSATPSTVTREGVGGGGGGFAGGSTFSGGGGAGGTAIGDNPNLGRVFAGRRGGMGGAPGGSGGRAAAALRPAPFYDNNSTPDQPPPIYSDGGTYRYANPPNTANYPQYPENNFNSVSQHPLSTFSIDVDTASYANIRRFLTMGQLPPHDAVRVEEMLNYFSYQYPQPRGEDPFAANIEVAGCPWNSEHRLVRIGLQGREIEQLERAPGNFVFLIDVSGSMATPERLPLIKQALRQLVKKMNARDRVAIVVYASEAGVKLPSTPCSEKERILAAIDSLQAGGSTNGGDGIQQAYRVARENYLEGGINRVLLCTDGDFNVGITDQTQLTGMIVEKAKSGVFLTTLGVGTDNYKDALMQKLADKGNGNYYYLDTLEEAQKVLIDQMNGTLVTIAKDVKIQIEFNPAQVSQYRLVGYEKRVMRAQDFNNDAKDAGEIGAGHTVTALYEIVPQGGESRDAVDGLKYQSAAPRPQRSASANPVSRELLTLKLRYKQPTGNTSRLLEFAVTDNGAGYERASADFRFAAAVASFGMLLQDSEFKGSATYGAVRELAQSAKGADNGGYRAEFINLVEKAEALQGGMVRRGNSNSGVRF